MLENCAFRTERSTFSFIKLSVDITYNNVLSKTAAGSNR